MNPSIAKRIARAKGKFDRNGACFICGDRFIDCRHSTGQIEAFVTIWELSEAATTTSENICPKCRKGCMACFDAGKSHGDAEIAKLTAELDQSRRWSASNFWSACEASRSSLTHFHDLVAARAELDSIKTAWMDERHITAKLSDQIETLEAEAEAFRTGLGNGATIIPTSTLDALKDALLTIGTDCESFIGKSTCVSVGRIRGARYSNENWCAGCIARTALEGGS